MGSVPPEDLGVSATPVSTGRGAGLGGLVTLLLETAGLLTDGGETALLSVAVLAGADPVDAGVTSDGLVVGVNHDDLVDEAETDDKVKVRGNILSNTVKI